MVTHVQTVANDGTSGASPSVSITTTAGNTLVLVAVCYVSANTPFHATGISDSHNTWTFSTATSNQNPPVGQSYDGSLTGFVLIGAVVNAAAVTSITLSLTGATPTYIDLVAYEFSGIPAGSVVSAGAASSTNVSAVSVTTPTVTVPSGAYVAVSTVSNDGQAGSSTTVGGSWTIDGGSDHAAAYQLSPSAGSLSATFSSSGSQNWPSNAILVIGPGGTPPAMPQIQPGPTWLELFKPGLPRSRPFLVSSTALEQGPFAVTLPTTVVSLSGTVVNPQDMPQIQPGPTWLDIFKPGLPRPRPPVPPSFAITGEQGPFNIVLPVTVITLSGTVVNPQDMPQIQPGPSWLDFFKPGWPRPRPPVPPVAVKQESGPLNLVLPGPATSLTGIQVETGPLNLVLPVPLLSLTGTRLRQPENLGAVLSLPTPSGTTARVTEDATLALADYGATLVLANFGASTTGWTMLTAPLNLNEFNDVTIDIAVTQNGAPYNLTGVTVNLLFKSAAGTPDSSALVFSSGGGSPAITITNATGGLAVAVIPNTDLDSEVFFFYRVDVVSGGLTNTCLYGPITWTSL